MFYVVFWTLSFAALGLFAFRIRRLYRFLSLGKKPFDAAQGKEKNTDHLAKRILTALAQVVGQLPQLKNISLKDRASLGHIFMAWGFMVFVGYYLLYIIIGEGFGLSEVMEGNKFFIYYSWVMDFMAPLVMIAALWGIFRRYVIRPSRLKGEQTLEALIILVTVFIHPLSHLLKEATSALPVSPLGFALSRLFNGFSASSLGTAHIAFFWFHWGTILFVLVFIAYSRYLHMIAAPLNILFKSSRPKGALKTINLENTETFGANKIEDFSQKQLLDLYACVICGRCQESCPAYLSGKELNPKKLILDLKKHLMGKRQEPVLVGKVISEDVVWACTTCLACQEECPVFNTHIDKIVEMRRNLVLERGQFPETAMAALNGIEKRGHPWLGVNVSRTDWTKDLRVKILSAEDSHADILYWVGCTAALNNPNMKAAVSLSKILKEAGVNFGILGSEEVCCGDPARRLGNEYLFQTLAKKNIETLNRYQVKKIITSCPHCFNTLKNEYPEFGATFEVFHHAEFIANLIKDGRLKLVGGIAKKLTYHDPCYLGRYNGIFDAPREILRIIPGMKFVEMKRSREKSFCCGGGGGRMWQEEDLKKRVNQIRAQDIIETEADIAVTSCPWCLQMLDDGLKTKSQEQSIEVIDLLELVEKALLKKGGGEKMAEDGKLAIKAKIKEERYRFTRKLLTEVFNKDKLLETDQTISITGKAIIHMMPHGDKERMAGHKYVVTVCDPNILPEIEKFAAIWSKELQKRTFMPVSVTIEVKNGF